MNCRDPLDKSVAYFSSCPPGIAPSVHGKYLQSEFELMRPRTFLRGHQGSTRRSATTQVVAAEMQQTSGVTGKSQMAFSRKRIMILRPNEERSKAR